MNEVVDNLYIPDLAAKRHIMQLLLIDPNYVRWTLETLQKSCQARGVNPVDCQVFMNLTRAHVWEGKIKLPL